MKKARKKPGKASDDDDDDEPHDSVSVAFVPKGKKARKKPGKASDDDDDDDDDSHDSASVVAVNARKKSGKKSGDHVPMRCPHPGCGMDIFSVVTSKVDYFPLAKDGQVNFNTSWRGEGAGISKEAITQVDTKLREGRDHFGYYHPGARFPPSLVRHQCPGIENFHKMCLAARDDKMRKGEMPNKRKKRLLRNQRQRFMRAVTRNDKEPNDGNDGAFHFSELKATAYPDGEYVEQLNKLVKKGLIHLRE
mgnify:CR=1 FL=1